MLNGKRVVVVLPAYNAERTLEKVYSEIKDDELVDKVLLVDDCSRDKTAILAAKLGLEVIRHDTNKGYGGNQKTCYKRALEIGADIVIMLHPDYQYTPKLVPAMAAMIGSTEYDLVLASRILGKGALRGGMPVYKYLANRFLTFVENILLGLKLSEYHTGYRAYSRQLLENIPFASCSDDFVFDNELIAQTHLAGFQIGELSCPTRYESDSSSINFKRSVIYGLGVLRTAFQFRMTVWQLAKPKYLDGVSRVRKSLES